MLGQLHLSLRLFKMLVAHTRFHANRTLSALRIRKRSSMLQSSVVAKARFLAFSKLSLGSWITPTRWSRSKRASTATNSTWANFAPGQLCGPSDQGRYVLRTGVKSISWRSRVAKSGSNPLDPETWDKEIHREGCQMRGSCQYLGCVWTVSRLGVTPVCGGITTVLSPIRSFCGYWLLHLGSARTGG